MIAVVMLLGFLWRECGNRGNKLSNAGDFRYPSLSCCDWDRAEPLLIKTTVLTFLMKKKNLTEKLSRVSIFKSNLVLFVVLFLESQDFSHEFICFFSGNQMGDDGARILAKALQINSKLR